MKNNKFYLVQRSGQGDLWSTIIGKEQWDWMIDDARKKPIPNVVLKSLEGDIKDSIKKGFMKGSADDLMAKRIKEMEAENADRCQYITADAGDDPFFRVKELLAFIRKNDIEIVDTYDGYLY